MTKHENNIRQLCESVINGEPLVPLAQEIFDFYKLPDIRGTEIEDGKMYRTRGIKLLAKRKESGGCHGCDNYINNCDYIDCNCFIFKEV